MPTSTANPIQPILDLLTPIITPDWGALIGLIPIALLLVVLLWLALTIRAFATAGPTRRAPARVAPVPPASLHMPGGSTAPILAALGAAALFAGVVIGGLALLVGASILVVTLLGWGREALRDYDHLEPTRALPAVVHPGPPPGVHMPGPSIRPLLGATGTAALLGGLVVGGWLLLVAVVFLVWTLVGWLADFTAEYRKVEDADRTGHIENIPQRGWPMTALQGFAAVFVIVAVAQTGILGSIGGGGASPSGSPTASGGGGGGGATGDLTVVAKGVAFDTHALSIGAGKAFTIAFQNQDPGVPHNIQLRASDGSVIQDQPTIDGGQSTVYHFQSLQPGTYTFICKVHPIPSMTGTLTVK
jgi:plastocyanin